jgi:hypothetical protein
MTSDTIVAFAVILVALLTSLPVTWRKNTFGILVCSKQYTLPIFLMLVDVVQGLIMHPWMGTQDMSTEYLAENHN